MTALAWLVTVAVAWLLGRWVGAEGYRAENKHLRRQLAVTRLSLEEALQGRAMTDGSRRHPHPHQLAPEDDR
jgi:hypothetical protein